MSKYKVVVIPALALTFVPFILAQQPKSSTPEKATTSGTKADMTLTDAYAKAALLASKAMRDRAADTDKLLREADVEGVSDGDRSTFALLNALPIYLHTNDLNKSIIQSRASIKIYDEKKPHTPQAVAQATFDDPDYQKILNAESACFSALDKMFRSRVADLGIFSEGECAKASPKITEETQAVTKPTPPLHTVGETFSEFVTKEPHMQQDIDHCRAAKKPAPACRAVLAMPTRTDRFSFRLPHDNNVLPSLAPMYTFDGGKLIQIADAP